MGLIKWISINKIDEFIKISNYCIVIFLSCPGHCLLICWWVMWRYVSWVLESGHLCNDRSGSLIYNLKLCLATRQSYSMQLLFKPKYSTRWIFPFQNLFLQKFIGGKIAHKNSNRIWVLSRLKNFLIFWMWPQRSL